MTGKVGLALGSGGLKGIAHIGVLQVFEENGVPVHMIAGSSAGAIIGSIYACGTDLSMLGRFIGSIYSRDYLDFAMPRAGRGGIIRGDRMQELIRTLTHDKTFEQTDIPFYCTAVDAETGELITFSRGKKLHECVRASMSIPGMFMPVRVDGRLLVDGGLLARVPCTLLREAGADVVIGVDVGYQGEPQKLPEITMRALVDNVLDIMQWKIASMEANQADIMLVPRVRQLMKRFSTQNTEDCIQEGRRAAEEAMPHIIEIMAKNNIQIGNSAL